MLVDVAFITINVHHALVSMEFALVRHLVRVVLITVSAILITLVEGSGLGLFKLNAELLQPLESTVIQTTIAIQELLAFMRLTLQ